MQFVNNYLRPVTLAAGATSLALDLPDGEYRLTLNSGDLYEIVGAVVVSGTATLVRGLEGTAVRGWGVGSVIFCDLTAGIIQQLFQRIEALEGSGVPATALTDQNGSALTDQNATILTGTPS